MSLHAPDQGFPNTVEEWWEFLSEWGDEKFSWGIDFDHPNLFQS